MPSLAVYSALNQITVRDVHLTNDWKNKFMSDGKGGGAGALWGMGSLLSECLLLFVNFASYITITEDMKTYVLVLTHNLTSSRS